MSEDSPAFSFQDFATSVSRLIAGKPSSKFIKEGQQFLIRMKAGGFTDRYRLVNREDGVAVWAEAGHEASRDLVKRAAATSPYLEKKGARFLLYLDAAPIAEGAAAAIETFRAAFREAVEAETALYQQIRERNQAVLERIRREIATTGRDLRVAFVVNDNTKWNSDSIFEEIDRREGLQARIFLAPSGREKTYERKLESYLKDRDFFARIDAGLIDLWDKDENVMKPDRLQGQDVVFYQQPWALSKITRAMVGQSLAVNMHYGYAMHTNSAMLYRKRNFHPYIWKFFSPSELHKAIHETQNPLSKGSHVVTGYPKLDVYQDNKPASFDWRGSGRGKKIIYAPHHSLALEELKISTFDWNHDLIQAAARNHPEQSWVYKPHGRLRYVVEKNGVMSKQSYDEYVQAWGDMDNGLVYDRGDYFDLFKTSDVMITDCSSFLGEYFPTMKPIIWLVSDRTKLTFNEVGQDLARTFYPVRSRAEFEAVFKEVIVLGRDPHAKLRQQIVSDYFPTGSSARRAVDFLAEAFR